MGEVSREGGGSETRRPEVIKSVREVTKLPLTAPVRGRRGWEVAATITELSLTTFISETLILSNFRIDPVTEFSRHQLILIRPPAPLLPHLRPFEGNWDFEVTLKQKSVFISKFN